MKRMDTKFFLMGLAFIFGLPNAFAAVNESPNQSVPLNNELPRIISHFDPFPSVLNEEALAKARARAKAMDLAHSSYWYRLMYYHQSGNKVESTVTQPSFFLTQTGRTDPTTELDALLTGLFTPNQLQPDESAACLFPVRRDWLVEQLQIKESDLPVTPCPALTQWFDGIQPRHATLVFSSDYMNSPSSMFGHTLLRLDPDDNEQTRLLAYAVNYAAQTDNSSSALYAIKGLTGLYSGSYSIMPYYEKVKEYNDFESRDLWEYHLKLTPDETKRLTKRVWELRFVNFPYYFLHSNCSYELLNLLEIARPTLSLQNKFPVYAIPTDTLRASLIDADLLEKTVYRPAFVSRLNAQADRATPRVIDAAKSLAEKPDYSMADLTQQQQAQASEMASDYLYYRFVSHEVDPEIARPKMRELLVRRSQNPVTDQRVTVPTPAADPSQGHLTSRMLLGAGELNDRGFADIEWRPAYHDLLDPAAGYRNGSGINFLQTKLRIQDVHLSLQKLTLISIDSLSPKTDFFTPLSWNFAVGMRQVPEAHGQFSTEKTHAVSYVQGGEGLAWQWGSALCYSLASGALEAGNALDQGWRLGAGPTLGCLWNTPTFSLQLQNVTDFWQDSHVWQNQWQVGLQMPLNLGVAERRQAVRFAWQQTQQGSQRSQEASASWLWYF